jgi:hypothetical protein
MSEIETPLSPLFEAALHEVSGRDTRVIDKLLSSKSLAYLAGVQSFAAGGTAGESILDSGSEKLSRLDDVNLINGVESWSQGGGGVDAYTTSPIVAPARLFTMSTTVYGASSFADNPLHLCLARPTRPQPNSNDEGSVDLAEMGLGVIPNLAVSLQSEVEADGDLERLQISTPDASQPIPRASGFVEADPERKDIPRLRNFLNRSSGANLTSTIYHGNTLDKISHNTLLQPSHLTKLQPLRANMSTSTRHAVQKLAVGALAAQLKPTPESNMGDFQTPIAPTAQQFGGPWSPILAAEAHFTAMVNALNKAKAEGQAVANHQMVRELEDALASAQHRAQEAEGQKSKAEGQLASVAEQLTLSQDRCAELERQLHKYKSALQGAQAVTNKPYKKDSGNDTRELQEVEATITNLTVGGHNADIEDRITQMENDLQIYRDAYGQAEWNIQTLEDELGEANSRAAAAEEEMAVTEQLLKKAEEELRKLRIDYAKLEDKASDVQNLVCQAAEDAEFNRSTNETAIAIVRQSAQQVATATRERGITNDPRSPNTQANRHTESIPGWQLQTVVRFLEDVMLDRAHNEGHRWLEDAAKELFSRLNGHVQQTADSAVEQDNISGSPDLKERQAKERATATEKHGYGMGFAVGLAAPHDTRIAREGRYNRAFYSDGMASENEWGMATEDESFYTSQKPATKRALRQQQKRDEAWVPEELLEKFKQQSVKIESPLMPQPLKVKVVQLPRQKDLVNSHELYEKNERTSAIAGEPSKLPKELAVHTKKARRPAVVPRVLSDEMRDALNWAQGSTIPKQLVLTRGKTHDSQSESVIEEEPQVASAWSAGANVLEQHTANIEKDSKSVSLLQDPAIPKELAERMARTRTSLVIPHELADKLKRTPSWVKNSTILHYDKELPVPERVREDTTSRWVQDRPESPIKSGGPNRSTASLKTVFRKESIATMSKVVPGSPKKPRSLSRLSNLSLRSGAKSPTKSVFGLKNPFRPQRMEPIHESYNGPRPGVILNPEKWPLLDIRSSPPPLPPKPAARRQTQSSPAYRPMQTSDHRPAMSSPPALAATAPRDLNSPFYSLPGSGAATRAAPQTMPYTIQRPPTPFPHPGQPGRSLAASPTPLPRQFRSRFRSATWLGLSTPPPFESLPLPDGLVRHGNVITRASARADSWPANFQRSEHGREP